MVPWPERTERPVAVGGAHTVAREIVAMASVPTSVRQPRAVVRGVLGPGDDERVERAAVRASELVANAVRPRPRIADDTEPTGRGTRIVQRLADRWGVGLLPAGKRVWCTLVVGPTPYPSGS